MAEREAGKTCPECGGVYLNIRSVDHDCDYDGDELLWGEVGCLSCGHSWCVGQHIVSETDGDRAENSPFEGWDFLLGQSTEADECPDCGWGEIEAVGRVLNGMLVAVPFCPRCGWGGQRRRYSLGKPHLID